MKLRRDHGMWLAQADHSRYWNPSLIRALRWLWRSVGS